MKLQDLIDKKAFSKQKPRDGKFEYININLVLETNYDRLNSYVMNLHDRFTIDPNE
jgi:hypothetical protein